MLTLGQAGYMPVYLKKGVGSAQLSPIAIVKAGSVRTLETSVEHPKDHLSLFAHTSFTPSSPVTFPTHFPIRHRATAHLKKGPHAALLEVL